MEKRIINELKLWTIEDIDDSKIDNLYLDNVFYDSKLRIVLKSKTHLLTFIFEKFVSFRVNDESYLLEYQSDLNDNAKSTNFSKIENSTFIKEMSFLSKDFFTDGGPDMIEHFTILTTNECIEVISDLHPSIEIIESPASASKTKY